MSNSMLVFPPLITAPSTFPIASSFLNLPRLPPYLPPPITVAFLPPISLWIIAVDHRCSLHLSLSPLFSYVSPAFHGIGLLLPLLQLQCHFFLRSHRGSSPASIAAPPLPIASFFFHLPRLPWYKPRPPITVPFLPISISPWIIAGEHRCSLHISPSLLLSSVSPAFHHSGLILLQLP